MTMQTKIFNLPLTFEQYEILKQTLLNGEVCILPTDTLYGVMVLAKNAESVQKLNETKQNPKDKPAQILCTLSQAKKLSMQDLPTKIKDGNLTAILKGSSYGVSLSGISSVGLRVPKDEFLQNLMQDLDAPLFASSANLHGLKVCVNQQEIKDTFIGLVPLIILSNKENIKMMIFLRTAAKTLK